MQGESTQLAGQRHCRIESTRRPASVRAVRLVGLLLLLGVAAVHTTNAEAALRWVGTVPLPGSNPGAFDVLLSPDGKHLYASAIIESGIVVFECDALTGQLSLLQQLGPAQGVGANPTRPALSPDGRHLYLGSASLVSSPTPLISVFERDPSSGLLAFASSVEAQSYPQRITVSPNGAHVYVSSAYGGFRAWSRDATSGALTPVSAPFLGDVNDLALTADGLVGYLVGGSNSSGPVGELHYSSRNPSTGELALLGGYSSIYGLVKPAIGAALSSGDTHLYVAGSGYLSVFRREPQLVSQEYELDGDDGVSGLAGAVDLVVGSDHVYVAAHDNDVPDNGGIAALQRDPLSGSIAYVEAHRGFPAPNGLALSPDGRYLYVAVLATSNIEIFAEEKVCPPAPRSDCRPPTGARLTLRLAGPKSTARFNWDNVDTSFALSGDPWGGSTYAFCLYEDQGGTQVLVAAADAPQGRVTKRRGWTRKIDGSTFTAYDYRDPFGTPGGIRSAKLERQHVRVRAKGENLRLPAVPPSAPFTVQVLANLGDCWTAAFAAANVRVSDPDSGRFVARLP